MDFDFIPRQLSKEITRLRNLFSVLVITGPRQSGKTTLVKSEFSNYHFINLENIALRDQVSMEPLSILRQHQQGLIIDEAQLLPEIFSYIQVVVDENPMAKFVLSGSSNFALMQGVSQSLAGRSAVLTLLPLSLNELERYRNEPTNILLMNGGYPAVWSKNIPVADVSRNYYNTYIERDVRQLLNVKDMSKFQTFIRLCAGRVGTELSASSLSNEIGLSVPTVQEWLSVLEASYILFRLPPFYKNLGKRLVKAPKIYFYDTGLCCFLLGMENESHLASHPLRGAIFENFVVLEFLKNRYNSGKLPNLYFYRDKSKREVDLLTENGHKISAFEIKSAKSFTKDFFKNLIYFKTLSPQDVTTCLVYDGEEEIRSNEKGMINFRSIPEWLFNPS